MSSSATVVADPLARIGRINPEHYSHFIEHLGECVYDGIWVGPHSPIPNTDGIRQFTIDALKAVGPAVFRWPGGCFADHYHWRDGIGDPASRPRTRNIFWGGTESNRFGTHEFIGFCRKIDAIPYICGNVGTGSPQEMMDWLEYCNGDSDLTIVDQRRANGEAAPLGIKYWGVGNENWGCGGNMRPQEYAAKYRNYVTYLARMNLGVQLIAVGHDAAWNRELLRALAGARFLPRLQALSIHRYFSLERQAFNYDESEYHDLIADAHVLEDDIAQADGILKNYEDPTNPVGLIVDEWGLWDRGRATPESGLRQANCLRDAVVAATCLNIFTARADRVTMTNIAQTINVLQCLIETRGPDAWLTPTYHVYQFYREHVGHDSLTTHVNSQPLAVQNRPGRPVSQLSASTSLSEDGSQVSFAITNRHYSESVECTLRLPEKTLGDAAARLLAGDQAMSANSASSPDAVAPTDLAVRSTNDALTIQLPPHSIAILTAGVG
jgi:alpha-N-arabinofuranosidase